MRLPVEEVRLNLGHIELAARLFGPEDGQPVIALHGWLDNANSFARLAPRLTGLRIVALDLAGHGHSGHRPAGSSYALADYVFDVLQVAEQLGWQRFALLGHSLGAIISVLLAGSLPERVTRLALIDGLIPLTGDADSAAERMGAALQAQLRLAGKQKPVYADQERAIQARMNGVVAVSREAAELLAQRGLMPVPGGYTAQRQPPDPAIGDPSHTAAGHGFRPRHPVSDTVAGRSGRHAGKKSAGAVRAAHRDRTARRRSSSAPRRRAGRTFCCTLYQSLFRCALTCRRQLSTLDGLKQESTVMDQSAVSRDRLAGDSFYSCYCSARQ